jgi:hypothetical protein
MQLRRWCVSVSLESVCTCEALRVALCMLLAAEDQCDRGFSYSDQQVFAGKSDSMASPCKK